MTDKKLIAVIGATGSQGGSVLEYLLNSGNYRVRGLTRDPTKTKCMQLKTKWGTNLEWTKCNVENADELIKAFEGCYGAFCVTDYWQDTTRMAKEEIGIGRIMIDSAVKAGLKHCIFSALHNVQDISEGRLTVPFFTNKAKIETYARTEFTNIDTAFSFVYAGFYMTDFLGFPGISLKVNNEGILTNDPALPTKETTQIPFLNEKEFGGFVLPMFDNLQRYKNQRVFAFNGYATLPEFIGLVANTLNVKSKYIRNTYDEYYQIIQELTVVHMLQWFDEFGNFGGDHTNLSVPFRPSSLEDAVKTIDWSSFYPSTLQRVGEKITQVKDTIVDTAERMKEQLWTTEQAQ